MEAQKHAGWEWAPNEVEGSRSQLPSALVPQGYLGPLLLEVIFQPSVGCIVFPPAFYTQLAL